MADSNQETSVSIFDIFIAFFLAFNEMISVSCREELSSVLQFLEIKLKHSQCPLDYALL